MRNAEDVLPYCIAETTPNDVAESFSSAMERPKATVYSDTKIVGLSETDFTSLKLRNLWPCSE